MKEEIIKHLIDKDRVSLVEIYLLFPGESKSKVRSILNVLVNTGKIKRLERGYYSHI